MPDFYGVRAREADNSFSTPISAKSGIVIAFGTAPVQTVGGTANTIVLAKNFDEAVAALGYSDNWDRYTLCEVMYSHFKLYGVAPLLLVNVLTPSQHKEAVAAAEMNITDGQIELTEDTIPGSIVVTNATNTETVYTAGTDYDVLFNDGKCIIEVLSTGAMSALTKAKVAYDKVSFTINDLATDLIGGYTVATGVSTGLELMDKAFYQTGVLPDILIAPGFSHLPAVAAVMNAKTNFSTVFRAHCICDLDCSSALTTEQAATAKTAKAAAASFQGKDQIVAWPMVGLGDKKYHLSTQIAGCQARLDNDTNGIPSRVASNKALNADRAILADGTEVILDLEQANFLRGKGIMTALNFVNGLTAWGAYTAAMPGNTDPKNMFINQSRMFGYVANSVILSLWARVDENLTPRYAESLIDEINMWLNSLATTNHLLGARCELRAEENPVQDISAGIVRVHIYMTPPSPAQEIDTVLEYDVDYVSAVLGGGEEA